MNSPDEILSTFGIARSGGATKFKARCPQFSDLRSRKKSKRCLTLTVEERVVKMYCHHCHWKGRGYFKGPEPRPEPVVILRSNHSSSRVSVETPRQAE